MAIIGNSSDRHIVRHTIIMIMISKNYKIGISRHLGICGLRIYQRFYLKFTKIYGLIFFLIPLSQKINIFGISRHLGDKEFTGGDF